MKKSLIILSLVIVGFVGQGCASSAGIAQALANDPATVSVRLVTPWGTETFTRVGGNTNSVTVGVDGSVVVTPPKSP